jgi:ATP-dependent Lon protease
VDKETFEEEFVAVPEQRGGKLIPEGMPKPGHIYTIGHGDSSMIGVYKIETEVVPGKGKFEKTGLGSGKSVKESIQTAFNYFKANRKSISGTISVDNKDYLMHVQDMQGVGMTDQLALSAFVGLCSGALHKPVQGSMAILGTMSIGGSIPKVPELANVLQACFDAGAKSLLIPMASAADIPTVPMELFTKFQVSFYNSPEDAVFKALGVN